MSRHGIYEGELWDDHDELRMWAWTNGLERAIAGKRGQAMLRDLAAALDAMPVKRLVSSSFMRPDGEVCALGALGRMRGIDMTELERLAREAEADEYDDRGVPELAAETFDVARSLVMEVMWRNDEAGRHITGEERWERVRRWVGDRIR